MAKPLPLTEGPLRQGERIHIVVHHDLQAGTLLQHVPERQIPKLGNILNVGTDPPGPLFHSPGDTHPEAPNGKMQPAGLIFQAVD